MGINLFRVLMIYLKPVLPHTAQQVESFLNIPALQWQDKNTPLLNHCINPFQPMINRIDSKQIEALKMAAQQDIDTSTTPVTTSTTTPTIPIKWICALQRYWKLKP
jgi:methionyl-tRNA synthetase